MKDGFQSGIGWETMSDGGKSQGRMGETVDVCEYWQRVCQLARLRANGIEVSDKGASSDEREP